MGVVKHQSIQSTVLIYIGFAIGGINTLLLFPHFFSDDEYALTRLFLEIGVMLVPFCTFSTGLTINRFYPYYDSHLPDKKNDLLSWSLVATFAGFLLFVLGTLIFKDLVIRKYSTNSPLFIEYFYMLYPYVLFFTLFALFESYSWSRHETVVPNFLKELVLRVVTTLLIVLYKFRVINFTTFLWLFSLTSAGTLAILLYYLRKHHLLHFTFRVSNVTRRLFRRMAVYSLSLLGATMFSLVAQNINGLIISSTKGLNNVAYLSIATYMATLIQVPQRSIAAIAIPVLAQSWKDKNLAKIGEIYIKSSLLQLIAALFIFLAIWLNIDDIFALLPPAYGVGKYVVFYLGISRVIDLGTGLNSQLLSTSRLWRFDLFSSAILLALSFPLNYFLIAKYGLIGTGYASLLSMFVFNTIRCLFIWKKFGLQPFSVGTAKAIGVAVLSYLGTCWLPNVGQPILDMMIRGAVFSFLFIFGILVFRVSDDISSTLYGWANKIRRRK
ncbi:lipopolysaccharide biosynthesis protein [Chitinophaga nivalis]|uniref:Oligosaccharide flippase family protein n=1 Tax=Chitinophaga nivalis TaxID=2991709 RepID=A0ABT3INP7_9BACT|nr:oligosaccharide flippase family protein [Chitinophaga nivalis]MCW3464717.1 oligosaccharide flippase family protein [Chitinophaga nivalis]MCW3485592.1 oligosaccharide flippase family protein [Chitinophaga nivalis]